MLGIDILLVLYNKINMFWTWKKKFSFFKHEKKKNIGGYALRIIGAMKSSSKFNIILMFFENK